MFAIRSVLFKKLNFIDIILTYCCYLCLICRLRRSTHHSTFTKQTDSVSTYKTLVIYVIPEYILWLGVIPSFGNRMKWHWHHSSFQYNINFLYITLYLHQTYWLGSTWKGIVISCHSDYYYFLVPLSQSTHEKTPCLRSRSIVRKLQQITRETTFILPALQFKITPPHLITS